MKWRRHNRHSTDARMMSRGLKSREQGDKGEINYPLPITYYPLPITYY
jgi:hypothetical protein